MQIYNSGLEDVPANSDSTSIDPMPGVTTPIKDSQAAVKSEPITPAGVNSSTEKKASPEKKLPLEKKSLPAKRPSSDKKPPEVEVENKKARKSVSDSKPVQEQTTPQKFADTPDPPSAVLERKSPRFKRKSARDAEVTDIFNNLIGIVFLTYESAPKIPVRLMIELSFF
jgi:hypothetical protein